MFTIDGATLTLTDNVTLRGRNQVDDGSNNNQSLIRINAGGTFTMSGGKISGNTLQNIGGAGVSMSGGSFNMNGGLITNTHTLAGANGGAMFIDGGGIFTMSGGTISGNSTETVGGGVAVNNGAFNMSGTAVISGNTATGGNGGGGVFVGSSGTFAMSGGTINANNNAPTGGGVSVGGGTFTMNGGTINGNNATGTNGRGGGVHVSEGSRFFFNSGTISGNTASGGGGVSVISTIVATHFNMTGGTITQNTATSDSGNFGGGGVFVSDTLSRFNMSGGSITGNILENTQASGAGVHVFSGRIVLGGTAVIRNNLRAGTNNNLSLVTTQSFIIIGDDTPTSNQVPAPAAGMEVFVHTTNTEGLIAQGGATNTIAGYFHADTAGMVVVHDNNQLVIRAPQGTAAFTLTFEQITEQAPILEEIVISRSGSIGEAFIDIPNPEQFTTIRWYRGSILMNDAATPDRQPSITLRAADIPIGNYSFTVEVLRDGVPYNSPTIMLRVQE
jgi:hypothetical protein